MPQTAADFLTKHDGKIEDAGMLLWCEAPLRAWNWRRRKAACTRREAKYLASVIIRTKGPLGKRRVFIRHLPGPTVTALKRQLRAEGLSARTDLRDRCESAGCSPRITDD